MGSEMKKVELEDGQSADIVSENISIMKELFPEAFSEGGVNFDTLRQLLGDASVLDEGEEKYGLNWHGKKKARQIALTPSTGTLLPCPEESVDWDTTQNLFIEGDNLEVLKLLQKSYANKIKMIFIDPPYNTGGEFIYPDKYQDNLDTYLRYTDQVDEDGFSVTSRKETSGRKHTPWLSMMFPRLLLAKNMLTQDGVFFATIDENERDNLKKLCDEVFGEENFLACMIWRKKSSPDARSTIGSVHDYILCYLKNSDNPKGAIGKMPLSEKRKANFSNPDNDPRGPWASVDMTGMIGRATKDQFFEVELPSGRKIRPPEGRSWGLVEKTFIELRNDKRIWFGKEGDNVPRIKNFLAESEGQTVPSYWPNDEVGSNEEATNELLELLEIPKIFDTPKPTRLLERMLEIATDSTKKHIVLDFFAGSCSTAHSLLKLNEKDKGNRRFIMVQLPELCSEKSEAFKAGYKTISEVGRKRLTACTNLIKSTSELDIGYRSFKLSSSNIQAWNPDKTDLEESLLSHEEHLVEGRSEQDVLYELLLKRGVDLAVPIESREVSGKNIYSIGYGVLFACLDELITKEQVEDIAQAIIAWYGELAPSSDTHVFFRDSAFRGDVSKTNMAAILEQNGITHVRSL